MLQAANLGKRYGARIVLRGLSFQVATGTVAAIVGANGSGKSTLLRIVAGLTVPSAGKVFWADSGLEKIGRDLGWMCGLSAPDAPLPRELTALENLEFLARLRGLPFRRPELLAHLHTWDLRTRAGDMTGDLSSGLRTRLQLAAATLHAPRVLLLDEPAANLDAGGRDLLHHALEKQRAIGIALVATNDPAEAALCDVQIEVAETVATGLKASGRALAASAA